MRVLVACEYSGVVREAFKTKGCDAWSCDILPTDIPGQHYEGDIRDVLGQEWDLIIAHPPCTYLANSGVRWLHNNPARMDSLIAGVEFFKLFLHSNCPHVCIENPIPHKYALEKLERKYSQIVQPWMFGHTEQKATCLWLKGLPKLVATNNVKEDMLKLPPNLRQRLHYLPPSKDRAKLRSKTFQGIAGAMAEQWTTYVLGGLR